MLVDSIVVVVVACVHLQANLSFREVVTSEEDLIPEIIPFAVKRRGR
jgi:hypothetical protein